ncbi:MAG: hypothetical protein M3R08_05530, partial [Bacteroidota bacterium]|nr:hypothetical protein [Bacteroidota bacterium]
LIAMELPYDAELQLDHLENSPVKGFQDHTDWYTLICWVCSGQNARALTEAERISSLPRHTYKEAAARMRKDLERLAQQ